MSHNTLIVFAVHFVLNVSRTVGETVALQYLAIYRIRGE